MPRSAQCLCDLGDRRRGAYFHDQGVIRLNLRLTRAQATATLAHELGPHRFGDTCTTPANERRAWEYGAALLITPREYATAEREVGHHLAALALELGVTPRIIGSWHDWWEKCGRAAAARRASVNWPR